MKTYSLVACGLLAFASSALAQQGNRDGAPRGWGPHMGMMGGGMGMCPMMAPDSKVEVKNLKNGVTITLTSDKPEDAVRLQKMAEGMRLMREAMEAK